MSYPRGDLRKASKAQENVLSHKERTRRFSNEHARTQGLVNDALGSLGQAVRLNALSDVWSTGQRKIMR